MVKRTMRAGEAWCEAVRACPAIAFRYGICPYPHLLPAVGIDTVVDGTNVALIVRSASAT